jgi:hypothetical protein
MFAGLIGDSFTHPWYNFVGAYLKEHKKSKMAMNDWPAVQLPWRALFSERLRKAAYDYFLAGRAGFEYERETDEETGKKQFVKSGVKAKLEGETGYEPDVVLYTAREQEIDQDKGLLVWREATILKDRSGLVEGKQFKNASWKDFEPVFLSLVKDGVPSAALPETDPQTLFERPDQVPASAMGKSRDALIGSIQAELNLAYPGASAAEKQAKLAILKDIFGDPSIEKIEAAYLLYPAVKSENPGPSFVLSLEDGLENLRSRLADIIAAREDGREPSVSPPTPPPSPSRMGRGGPRRPYDQLPKTSAVRPRPISF